MPKKTDISLILEEIKLPEMNRYVTVLFGLLVLLFSCSSPHDQISAAPFQPKVISAYGNVVPKVSLALPEIIRAGKPTQVFVGPAITFPVNPNICLANDPKHKVILTPVINTMGEKGIEFPKPVRATENSFFCKAPEVVLVKDAYSKDINPQNFSSFSKLQGLRHDQIRSMTQDKMGNIWLGTDDGLTKYDGKYFSHYTTDQGLNNNLILSVFQDKKGNLWFGTFGGGVTRYDGRYLTVFTASEGLSNNVVNCIFEDNAGNIWLGTGGGAIKFDGKYFTSFTQKEGLCHNDVRSILQDDSGKIWISTNGAGISVFDGKSFSNYSEKEGLVQNYIPALFKDTYGNIWLGTVSKGVIKFDGTCFAAYSENEGFRNNSVRTILEDKDRCMWFGSSVGGLSKFDGKSFIYYGEKEGLSTDIIRCSLKDRNGNLWFGTRGGGLVRFDGDLFTHLTTNDGLSNSRIMSILQDRSGNLWFGTFGGYVTKSSSRMVNGIKQRYFSLFGEKEGIQNSRIYSMLQDRSGNIWFGSDGGGVSKFDGKTTITYTTQQGLCSNSVRKIYQDRDGNFWFATYGSGVSKYDGTNFTNYSKKSGLSSNNVLSILQDSGGKLWFGTDGGGITCLDGKTFVHYTKEQGFFNNIVYCILQDRDGTIWFGTGGDGVIKYDGKSFTRFADDVGLSNNHILSIIQDSRRNICVGTRLGPHLLKMANLEQIQKKPGVQLFKSYGFEDGFTGIGCNLGAISEDKDGTIWIGTNDRLTAFHVKGEKADSIPPNLQLNKVQLFNEDIPWAELAVKRDTTIVLRNGVSVGNFRFNGISQWFGLPENLKLDHKQNYITFGFIGIAHEQTKKIKYQVKLEGFDENWSAPTDRTEASYGNLYPGHYIFKVKATNSEGYKSNEVAYRFSIRPPWWKTWWFYISFVVGVIVLIYCFIKYRERRFKHDKQLLQLKVQEQTHELTKKNEELIAQKNEILEKNAAIEKKNEELQISNAEKDKFFSIIAHDLRSPFNGFLGLTQIMAEDLPNLTMTEIQEIAVSMRNSANNLFRLLENLLQWARMQQGLIHFNPTNVQLLPNIEESMAMVVESAKNKGIDIACDVQNDLWVYADSNILQTILRNLVSNAVKFTPKGGQIWISATTKGNKCIEISIKDTGIGMSREMIDQLFMLDLQKNRKGTEGEPSTGLGLLLCKEFVEKHGGKFWVESEEDKGTVFYFTLPFKEEPNETTDIKMMN